MNVRENPQPGLLGKILYHAKLRTKLIIAFMVIVLFVIAQGIATYQFTRETTSNFEIIVESSAPSINALDQMKAAETALVQAVVTSGLQREMGTLTGVSMANDQELSRFQDNWRLMQEGLQAYKDTAAEGDSERISELELASFNVYNNAITYLTLTTQIDEVDILLSALENLEAADTKFDSVLQTTLQAEAARLSELSEISSHSSQNNLLFTVASSVALILTTIVIGFIVIRTVAQPIRDLEGAAQNIGQGDYSQRIDVRSGDEIGHLTGTFNTMADAIQIRDQELHELNEELAQRVVEARESHEQADRANQAKSIFLSNMSHELRTPLNMVIGYTSSMLNMPQMYAGQTLPEIFREDVQLIQQNGQHLLTLINDLLDLSKIEAGKLELQKTTVDLNEIFRGVVSSSLGLVGERPVQVRVNSPDDLPLVWADPVRVRQILLNLMSNAIKFTKTGSVTLFAAIEDDQVLISVQDTGIGISKESLESIFDRFQQVQQNSEIQGTGLGLDISQQLAIMHGSKITIESVVGQGSTFSFPLSLATPDQIAEPPVIANTASTTATVFEQGETDMMLSHTILVVEDDSSTRALLHRILEAANHAVVDAQAGKLAIEFAQNLLPDLIILDIQLPDMDGWDVLQKIRQDVNLQSIPVIVLSVDPEFARAAEFNVEHTFAKPIDTTLLLETVNSLFSQPHVEKQGE